jgi:hypothetical protein
MEMEPTPLFNSVLDGPRLWTGGAIGPEGSILTLILGFGLGLYLLYRAKSENKFLPPFWRE